jgi:hypothetical protein
MGIMNKKVLLIYGRFALVLFFFFIGAGLIVAQITLHSPYQSENISHSMGLWYVLDFIVFGLAIGLLANTIWTLAHPPYSSDKKSVSH